MQLSQAEKNVCRLIEQRADALLEDLKLHVALPTGGWNLAAIDETRERFASRLSQLGADFELIQGTPRPNWLQGGQSESPIPPTAICRRTTERDSLPKILIAGHLDTVHDPEGNFRELSIAPDGKTATGPGCVDMKGGLVIALAALEALQEAGIDAAWSFLMNADEETGSYHSDNALRSEATKHDLGLALEPALAGGELAIERMGSGQFLIETRGRAAHVGREFSKGISAVTALAEQVIKVAAMPDPDKGLILNIGPIQGNNAANAVPDLARAWGNVRYPTPQAADELGAMLDALITQPDAMPGVTIRRSFNRPAKPLIPAVEKLAQCARDAAESLGQTLPFAKTGGVCDGNILQDAGLPTIDTLGVRGGGLHTPDEWIELPSLVERCQMLAVLITRVSSGALA